MSILKIAKMAGVSHTTVARVINNSGNVNPDTARKVREVMEKIGYSPKPPHLRPGPRKTSKTLKYGNIAFLSTSTGIRISRESPIMTDIMHTISDKLANNGLSMVQGVVGQTQPLSPIIARGEVDGIFIFHDLTGVDERTKEFLRQYPIVYLLSGKDDIPGDRVCPDNRMIGKIAAEYLISKGCRNIVYLNPRRSSLSSWTGRWEEFSAIARSAGVRVSEFLVETADNVATVDCPRVKSQLERFVQENFVKDKSIDGIFVGYDVVTAVLYPILYANGVDIKNSVEIISCNNEVSLLAGLEPKPARIDLQPDKIGKYAVSQLLDRMKNKDDQKKVVINVQPELIE